MTSQMRREIDEIPDAVARLLERGQSAVHRAAHDLRQRDPAFLMSVARGSSDHVCTFLKYASELLLGLPMASIGPSVASVYGVRLRAQSAACLAVSQSGQSPDILRLTEALRAGGAYTAAITNDAGAPLAQAAHVALDIHAGPERSVAATKTFVTSLITGLWLLAEMRREDALIAAIRALPAHLEAAIQSDWEPLRAALDGGSLYTLGRGPAWAISNEAALKFKETCQIHAESYSSAEVLHGPVSLVARGFPVLAFAAGDAAEPAVIAVADQLAETGAQVFATSDRCSRAQALPHRRTDHWLTDPIPLIVSFYGMVEQVALDRGLSVDQPRHLRKVTETL